MLNDVGDMKETMASQIEGSRRRDEASTVQDRTQHKFLGRLGWKGGHDKACERCERKAIGDETQLQGLLTLSTVHALR